MAFFPLPVQAQPFSLSGSGAVTGDTTITLKSFKQIDGTTNIAMSDFGSKGFGTLEPGNSTLEEQISFTGVTQNSNGTATLTGVKTVLFTTPFTETSGLAKTHAGSTTFIISNDSGFYSAIKDYIDTAVSAGAVPATTTVNGIGHVSVAPSDPANPIFVGTNDPRVPTQSENDALVGVGGSPSSSNLFVTEGYRVFSPIGMVSPYAGTSAPTGWLLCDGSAVSRSTYAALFAVVSTTFGVGDGSTTFNVPNSASRSIVGVGTGTKVLTFSSRSSNTITSTGSANSATNEVQTGQSVLYHSTATVITGLTDNTSYFLIRVAFNQFQLATTLANAVAGTPISLSSDGTGTQTFTMTLSARALADTGGEETHALTTTQLSAHTHTFGVSVGAVSGTGFPTLGTTQTGTNTSDSTGGSTAHNNMQSFLALNYIIKT